MPNDTMKPQHERPHTTEWQDRRSACEIRRDIALMKLAAPARAADEATGGARMIGLGIASVLGVAIGALALAVVSAIRAIVDLAL